jgi:5-formyltetrahydrofolate cyclo-ligase
VVDLTSLPPAKGALREEMRNLRRALSDRPARSDRIWSHVTSLPTVDHAQRILVFATIPGEPDTSSFIEWCLERSASVSVPEDGVDPGWPDVVIVPGLAFTSNGDRLGQGGGWYDRFLSAVGPECVSIGVCFADQLVDVLPLEPHDVAVDHVVTELGVAR